LVEVDRLRREVGVGVELSGNGIRVCIGEVF
jgi:hypothetical protein